jgi:Ca2+-binding EF-hand superfamily protein
MSILNPKLSTLVQAIFDSVDTDGSGYLDEEELSKCYEAVGVKPDRWL